MPGRLRDRHVAQVLEALIQYAADGGRLAINSDGVEDKLVISFTVEDSTAYDARLLDIMRDDPRKPEPAH